VARIEGARAARIAGLYAVTPDVPDTDALACKVSAAVAGGAAVVQYRNKFASRTLRLEQAAALAAICRKRNAIFIVNDDADIAAEVDADGVHIGEDDADIATARTIVGAERIIGVSCYNEFERAERAMRAGADYVAFGSFYPSSTKPLARRADPSLLTRARALGVPIVAIGGITSENAHLLIDAGADALAVISDVFAHDDSLAIERSAAAIAARFSTRSRAEPA
jgi:thiamine-phosphate pyrophosphorylase